MTTLELDQASEEVISLSINPNDLVLDPLMKVRIEFREDLSEPPAGVLSTESGGIVVEGQKVILNFSYEWLRNLRFTGPRQIMTLYGTLVFRGEESGSASLNLRITRSFTLGAI